MGFYRADDWIIDIEELFMTKDEALDLALEALEYWDVHGKLHQPTEEAITAIKQALAQPVQQPVAWMDASGDIYKHELYPNWNPPHTPLYTTPPAQPAVPDAIHHTDTSETLEYIQGWNDCRAAMLQGKK